MEYLKIWIKKHKIKVNDYSKETKCNQIVICKISNPSKKKDIAWIFEANIEFFGHILKLKGITKFNMIMIINYFYTNSYRL
jgi:hypothetical protein